MSSQLGIGEWGLFCGPEAKQLVICGDEVCGPVSARKLLEEVPRRLLLDEGRVTQATLQVQGDTAITVEHGGQTYRVETRQIVSPWSHTIVGVFAGVWPADQETPPPPLVGSWEWVVSMNGSQITGRRTFWNRELFDLYEVADDLARRSFWEVDVWASELIVEGDTLRFFTSLRDGYWDDWAGVRCATFNAIAGYGTTNRHKKHLRLVASKGKMSNDTELIFQGFSYEVPEVFADRDLAEEYPTDNALDAFMSLVNDPIAIVDPFTLQVLMNTPAWRREEFGQGRSLRDVLTEDPTDVRDFLIDAADAGSTVSTRDLEMRTGNGPRNYHVSVLGIDRGPGRDPLALVRLNS
ncbi:hypothetical protein [Curtobacterium sp. MCBD17_040]|uniref:hypothetical protein n=1 Tax=Curtobacterium sp. MCBD17_040 TaxID=2175674 RepID=UPI0011B604FD|nr:hypothetical protein [Curtobacterium sp. MCBD17_040]WIB65527.1 hypothetical protein DEI94_19325 [Curtobacterium sp. MCBD17_040]